MSSTLRQLKSEIEKLRRVAYKDELTGLYNRHGFKEEAEKFIREVAAFKKHPRRRESVLVKNFSIVIFDIDNFKKINDTHGHQTGDKVLKHLSEIISERIRDIDIAARWGGEEIVIGLVGANEKDACKIANGIRIVIEKSRLKSRGKIIKFTASGGVAGFESAKNFNTIFHLADKALYKAKKTGKNRVVSA